MIPEVAKIEARRGSSEETASPSHLLGGLGSTVSSPNGVRGSGVLCNFSTQDGYSQHFTVNDFFFCCVSTISVFGQSDQTL